ncbi:hypothetical protein BH23GEM9_BH23GEM9_20360 [soil metagenome]
MHCPQCGRPALGGEPSQEAGDDTRPDDGGTAASCPLCERPYPDSGTALLRLLTRLANCGLVAEAPTVLDTAETGAEAG